MTLFALASLSGPIRWPHVQGEMDNGFGGCFCRVDFLFTIVFTRRPLGPARKFDSTVTARTAPHGMGGPRGGGGSLLTLNTY